MSDKPNFVQRVVEKLTPPKPPPTPSGFDPWAEYRDPDAPAPVQTETVTVEHLTPEQFDRRAKTFSDAQREGLRAAAAVEAHKYLDRYKAEQAAMKRADRRRAEGL